MHGAGDAASCWAGRAASRRSAPIPAWPLRLMMVQLALIYFLNGWHKTGEGWREGSALYYALNLDHFYRVPAQGVVAWLQQVGVLPLATWITRGWELCFPLALLGVALRGYEGDRRAGTWPTAGPTRRIASWLLLAAAGVAAAASILGPLPASAMAGAALVLLLLYRMARARFPAVFGFVLDWVLGKRVWLVFGLVLHLGIDLGMNIGTFPQVMMAVYLAWLSAPEIEAFLARRAPAPLPRSRSAITLTRRACARRRCSVCASMGRSSSWPTPPWSPDPSTWTLRPGGTAFAARRPRLPSCPCSPRSGGCGPFGDSAPCGGPPAVSRSGSSDRRRKSASENAGRESANLCAAWAG